MRNERGGFKDIHYHDLRKEIANLISQYKKVFQQLQNAKRQTAAKRRITVLDIEILSGMLLFYSLPVSPYCLHSLILCVLQHSVSLSSQHCTWLRGVIFANSQFHSFFLPIPPVAKCLCVFKDRKS